MVYGCSEIDLPGLIGKGNSHTRSNAAHQGLEVVLFNAGSIAGTRKGISLYEAVGELGLRFDKEAIGKRVMVADLGRKTKGRIVIGPIQNAAGRALG